MGEQNDRAGTLGRTAFFPLGIVFFALAVALLFVGNLAWLAFFTMAITFLIVGWQSRRGDVDADQ
ncbi:hypothetical protein ACFUTU_04285 [Arthrobacter sp. NPDC057388]|jgi:hypothetical protein|uniref:hypothetical protein n=1 Tax=Arthrobacter sp. NPDC057388 TaxID=3346116 RepID=UPI00363A6368